MVGDLAWRQRERDWLLEDIEYFVEMVDKWDSLGQVELAQQDRDYLKEKRAELQLLRENPRKYEADFKQAVVLRAPVRAEES